MSLSTTTTSIHIIDLPGGGVMVYTTSGSPIPGQRLTPGQALATDLLNLCTHRASDVRYWHGKDKALELVQELINPDQYGYAVSGEVARAARRVLGLPLLSAMQEAAPATTDAGAST